MGKPAVILTKFSVRTKRDEACRKAGPDTVFPMSWFAYPVGLAAYFLIGVVPVALLIVFLTVLAYVVQAGS